MLMVFCHAQASVGTHVIISGRDTQAIVLL